MTEKKITTRINDDATTVYVSLPSHPKKPIPGLVTKTISIDDFIPNYKGPQINLDFDHNGELIGIEILA